MHEAGNGDTSYESPKLLRLCTTRPSTLTGTVTTVSKTDGTEISVSVNPGEFTVGTSPIKGDCDAFHNYLVAFKVYDGVNLSTKKYLDIEKTYIISKSEKIMKRRYIVLGIVLVVGLFVFFTNGTAGDVEDLYNYCDSLCIGPLCECRIACEEARGPEGSTGYDSPWRKCSDKCTVKWRECWDKCMDMGEIPNKCENGICDAVENCATCPNDCPCDIGMICNPSDSNADAHGCAMPEMSLTVSTDKKTYSPGETVIIRGSVWDAEGGLDGATVVVDVDGTKLTATAYSTEKYMGKYECEFPLPSGITQGEYTVTATASYSGYPSVSKSTTFSVGEMGITVKTADFIPIPGEMPLPIKAVLDEGKPMKGRIVDVQVVDENDKRISWVSVEQDPRRGSTLEENGEIEPILKVREPEGLERPTYLKDWPLKATIKIKISDKGAKKALVEKTIELPFNLALIHGVVVDNKDLKPVIQHFVPEVLGISESMVFDKDMNPEGDFWVIVRPYHPRSKTSIGEFMAKMNDFRLKWDVYDNLPLVYSIDEAPEAGECLELGKVSKTPLEKIKALYNEFGRTYYAWPDGAIEATPLVGPYDNGNVNNFMAMTGGCPKCQQYGCVALQYKTLTFLNNLKQKKADDEDAKFLTKLKGWDYMPVYATELPLYPQHNAVVLWDRAALSWKDAGIILDPHAPQAPDWYSVTAIFGNTILLSWKPQSAAPHDEDYESVYPRITGDYLRYNLKYFDDNIRPPWPKSDAEWKRIQNQILESPLIEIECPVDILIVNSNGQRLGILSNGDTIAEFEPIDLYFWVDEEGDKQWFFALPPDTYDVKIIGTSSGKFHLLTALPGEEIHDYGDNPIAAGEQATLTMNPEEDELILANGKEVTPTIIKLPDKDTAIPQHIHCSGFTLPPTEEWGRETWFNTHINVTSEQSISITASGTMIPSRDWDFFCGPNGTLEFEYWQNAFTPNPDWGHTALIARIGLAGDPIFIGTNTSFTAPIDGELWLGINDYDGSNNLGEYVTEICLGEEMHLPPLDGEPQQLYPVADGGVYAYTYRNWNWANQGMYVSMGAGWHPVGGEKRTYLRFDIPSTINIDCAVLKLYQYHKAGSVPDLSVYRVTSSWDEGTDAYHSGVVEETAAPGELCWMQQPSFDPVPVANLTSATTVPEWVEVDITSLVQQWQSGTPNYGLVIKTTNENPTRSDPEAMSGFHTKDHPDQATHPVLELSVMPQVQQLKISDLRGFLNTDNDCNLYVADWGDNQVKMINPDGSTTTYASGIDRPRYQVFDPAGNLYVGSFDGNIYNVSASGGKTVVASGIWSPQGMGFDGTCNLYVAGGYDGKIHRIAPDGSKTTIDSGFAHPKHLAVYSDGNIYVVDSGGTLIVRITLEGGKASLVDLGETISGMATDGEYLYVSHADNISRIDTFGQVTQIATDLDQPTHLTVCNGSVFVTVSDGIVKLKISDETKRKSTGSGTSYLEATLTHTGFDFSEGTTGEYPTYDGEVIYWQPGAATHPDYPRDSGYLWWRNTHLDDVNHASQSKDMGAVDIATVRAVPAEWDKSPLIHPLLRGHTIVAKCYDGYVKFQVISVDTVNESARVKYEYSLDMTFDEGTPTPTPTPTPAPAGSCDWSGTWQTNWGEMVLSQAGTQVSGTYTHDAGRITGTLSGSTLIGSWSEAPSYSPRNDAGDVQLTIAADCNSFTGTWRYGSSGVWSEGWAGTRTGAAPTTTPTPTPTPSPTQQ